MQVTRFLAIIPVLMVFLFTYSCINRDESKDEILPTETELSFEYDSTGVFVADSVHVTIDDLGSSGLWILTISAFQEYPDTMGINIYVNGIQLPGLLDVDNSGLMGAIEFDAGSGNIYAAEAVGSGGPIEVEIFEAQVRVKGNFEFVLINTALDDTLFITNGLFDTIIDESLYITP